MQEYVEQVFSSFPMLDNRFGRKVFFPFSDVVVEADKVIII
jgi:hypothetical protein